MKIYLSPPEVDHLELNSMIDTFNSNWLGPTGKAVNDFTVALEEHTNSNVLLTNSGTSAIHLALLECQIEKDDIVLCQSLTFAATAFPVTYCNAHIAFIDSSPNDWNICPIQLEKAFLYYQSQGKKVKAVIAVSLYGKMFDVNRIKAICSRFKALLIEDSAESMGTTYFDKQAGTFGDYSVYSFNGNKIITTSGGGALISNRILRHSTIVANQAKEDKPYYHHEKIGYNYRFSNLLASIGLVQLKKLEEKVLDRRKIFNNYLNFFEEAKINVAYQKELPEERSNRWLSVFVLNDLTERQINLLIEKLSKAGVEARRTWKPLHMQPIFDSARFFGTDVAENVFCKGICLPSGGNMTESDFNYVINQLKAFFDELPND